MGEVVGQLAQAPVGEEKPEGAGPSSGEGDEVCLVACGDAAWPAAGPVRVQAGQSGVVEGVDGIPDGVGVGRGQLGDRGGSVLAGRGEDQHRATDLHRLLPPAPHDAPQGAALLVRQPPGTHRSGHHGLLPEQG